MLRLDCGEDKHRLMLELRRADEVRRWRQWLLLVVALLAVMAATLVSSWMLAQRLLPMAFPGRESAEVLRAEDAGRGGERVRGEVLRLTGERAI